VSTNDTMLQLMNVLSQMPLTITTILKQPVENPNQEQLVTLYVALYLYCANELLVTILYAESYRNLITVMNSIYKPNVL